MRDRAPGLTKPFQVGRSVLLAVSSYAPFFDEGDRLQGVFAVNIGLTLIQDFLHSLQICEGCRIAIVDEANAIGVTLENVRKLWHENAPSLPSLAQVSFLPNSANLQQLVLFVRQLRQEVRYPAIGSR